MARTTITDLKVEFAHMKEHITYIRTEVGELKITMKELFDKLDKVYVTKEKNHDEHQETRQKIVVLEKDVDEIKSDIHEIKRKLYSTTTKVAVLTKEFAIYAALGYLVLKQLGFV